MDDATQTKMLEATKARTCARIEICPGPEWPGRSPARRFVAEAVFGRWYAHGWGATPIAAARAARAAFKLNAYRNDMAPGARGKHWRDA